MLQRMVDERLYWVVVHSRWADERNWPAVREVFFGGMPFPLSRIVPRMARKQMRAALHAQGTGRHTSEEIYALGATDLAALSTMLGDRPTMADVTVFACLINIVGPELANPLRDAALGHDNLMRHTDRMGELYAPKRQRQPITLTLAA